MPRYRICLIVFFSILHSSISNSNLKQSPSPGNSEERREDGTVDGPCMIGHNTPLTRLDGVKVGHVSKRDLGDKIVNIVTRAMKPPVFEIPNFLSDRECDYIINLAKEQKLKESIARGGLTTEDDINIPKVQSGRTNAPAGHFEQWDYNDDGIITSDEAILFAKQHHFLRLNNEDLLELFHRVNATEMDDGNITFQEFQTLNTLGLDTMMHVYGLSHPKHRHRYSEQTWINQRARKHDSVLNAILDRVLKLTGLSKDIIYGSERLQVVRYTEQGHYHAHYDSETHTRKDVPCCHLLDSIKKIYSFINPCRLCRYATILYYLNDVESGGETAFPVADNATLDRTFMETSRAQHDYYNLNENCKLSNLVVKPKKGLAIMWYNHHRDEESGWLGAQDDYSLHGGCALHRGTKWIANNWILAPYKEYRNISSLLLTVRDYGDL